MKNQLTDLNDHLFSQLERLNDEDIKGEALEQEIERSKAIAGISDRVINNAALVLKAQIAKHDGLVAASHPMLIEGDKK